MLKAVWPALANNLGISGDVSSRILCNIQAKYSEPWRFYHDHTHIEELLTLSEKHRDAITDMNFVNLCIIFHDIEYYVDERAPQNEKLSAELFMDVMGDKVEKELAVKVVSAIEATKSHSVAGSTDGDLQLFMDFDMAILGAPRSKYALYAQNIRKEYGAVEKSRYCVGRSGFFRNYLANTSAIYATTLFRDCYEQPARDNIAWECSVLESGRLLNEEEGGCV
jgi:predicted metal-dependent HD superfamily phosphohydrolase